MYTSKEHFNAADQCLRQLTSDEVNTDIPPQHPGAPTQSHDYWQHPPHQLPSLPDSLLFTAQYALSPPPETCGFTNVVNADSDCLSEPWTVDGGLLQSTFEVPTPPFCDNTLHSLQPRINGLEPTQRRVGHSCFDRYDITQRRLVPNGLPLSPEDFLPQTRAYLAPNANINANKTSIWNTDATGGTHKDRTCDSPPQPESLHQQQLFGYPEPHTAPPLQPQIYQPAPTQAVQPRRASSIASSPLLTCHYDQLTQLPVMQEWRTDNLNSESLSQRSHSARHPCSYSIDPQKTSRRPPVAAVRRKKEKYRQKGAARRNTIAVGTSKRLAYYLLPQSRPSKPEPADAPPAKRRKVTATAASENRQNSQHVSVTNACQNPHDDQEYISATFIYPHPHIPVYNPSIIELPSPSADELPQAIVGKYEEYKWSVFHYQLQPKGYDFAQRWFQEMFDTILYAEYKKRHFSHVSQGFIKDGDRYSILVLHNAANPFEYEHNLSSTNTVGMYGYHWHQHNEIHWTTLATDQRHFFVQCLQAGWLVERYRWTHDAKPTDKRFHRAYWLAANRKDMGSLLDRGPLDDKPHDLVEENSNKDPDKDFGISETGLTNEWDVTDAEAAAAWQRVQDEVEALGEDFHACGPGWQHIVIASTE